MSAFMAAARRIPFSMAALLGAGREPGCPVQMGQMLVFGGSPQESALQEQKILLLVLSWMWVSRPMTASYEVILATYAGAIIHVLLSDVMVTLPLATRKVGGGVLRMQLLLYLEKR